MVFFGNSESGGDVVYFLCQRRKFRAGFDSDPENARRLSRREKTVPAKGEIKSFGLNASQRVLDLLYNLDRLFADELQCYVQRFRTNPARIRCESANPFHESLKGFANSILDVESNKYAHLALGN